MAVQKQTRRVGDTRTVIAATLKRPDNTVEDLTGLTLTFQMTDSKGSDKVAETASNVTVTDASAGQVEYAPQADDVDTEGTYFAYFRVADGTDKDTFPAILGEFKIEIVPAA